MKTASVLVSTYNRPRALHRVLEGLARQTIPATEIIIGDDGSTVDTREVIDYWRLQGLPISHLWHDDNGFRKAVIMNRAIKAATSDLLIFLDGDCVPLSSFVYDHLVMHESDCIHAGPRMLANPSLTEHIEAVGLNEISVSFWIRARINGSINRLSPLLRFPDGLWRKRSPNNWECVRGCNFSVAREAILAVDGFDGCFVGWGFEDSDIAVRLLNYGLTVKSLRFAAPVVHLWHPEASRSCQEENLSYLVGTQQEKRIQARKGLSSLSE